MPNILRIIDANANRAREALRVMEESARFLLDDTELSAEFKMLRHNLAVVLAPLDMLCANRNTNEDVGTEVSTKSESTRESTGHVVLAAGKRLSEAFRVLEEYGKLLPPSASNIAPSIEKLRYQGYELEQRLARLMVTPIPHFGSTGHSVGMGQWRLCLLLTEALCTYHPWQHVMEEAIRSGVDCIQLREKNFNDRQLFKRAQEIIKWSRPHAVSVIVNDRPDIALVCGADGVHLGQNDLDITEVRKIAGRQLIVGLSTSDLKQAEDAQISGADYCGVGPMFPTSTKYKKMIVGPDYLYQYRQWDKLPHLAIGGINPRNIGRLVRAGVRGIAVSSCVCAARDPGLVVKELLNVMIATESQVSKQLAP
ncbi:MAG: thiamine phosphate synthase [Phycisphaeraceae bacterium]|nr:thiamine phosphate synthase [Phycisphaeraceae bacterium]|tara:strand:+ start:1251 stop:2351 length:1101 start_codon:yes stop_codon:yes gene_type:complete